MKRLASIVSLALMSLVAVDAHAQQQMCGDGVCVHMGTSIVSVTGSQSELLDSTLTSLSGVNVDLTQAQYQSLASTTVNLEDLTASIQTAGLASSPQTALSNQISMSQLTGAVADTLRTAGSSMAADAVTALSTQTMSATGTLALGALLGGTSGANVSTGKVNTLDLINGIATTRNLNSNAPAKAATTTGSLLGLTGNVGGVQITVIALDQPMFVCGPVGTQFYSGALRVRIHADVSNSNTPLSVGGILTISLSVTGLDLVASIARATGTIQAIDAISLAVTVQVTPGVAELYLGKVSDAALADRNTPLSIASNVDYATVASVAITGALGLNATATVDARAYALGTAPGPITLNFVPPYPQTKTATTNPNFISQLVTTLLNSLDIRVSAFAGPLNLGALLTPVITTLTDTLKGASGTLGTLLTGLVTTALEPLLEQLGIGLGRVDVTVDSAQHVPVGSSCNDGLFCTDNDICNAAGMCVGTPRTCNDGLNCTTDSCDETNDLCTSTLSSGCAINGACYAATAPNPTNQCQTCTPGTSATTWTNKASGQSCTDGLFCTENETCNGSGACVGTPRSCSDSVSCTTDTCNEATDTCSNVVSSGCAINGACYSSAFPNPANPCQSCNPSISTTSWTNKSSGAPCTDGLFCTVNDACDGAGNCTSVARSCSDGNNCTLDTCSEAQGQCVSSVSSGCAINNGCYGAGVPNPSNPCQVCNPSASTTTWSVQSGASCSDGSFCTQNDTCNASGVCTGTPRTCNDGISCTADFCNENTGRCENTQNGGGCIINGGCYGSGDPNPSNPCQWCNTSVSTSTWANRPSNWGCSDGQFCTVNDTCNGNGVCGGVARDCGSGSGCSGGVCDESNDQCTPVVQGCTINGACYVSGSINPSNPCQYCAPGTNQFVWSTRLTGSSCSDGSFCTVNDTCNGSGQCVGVARDCSDGSGCTSGFCNESQNQCETTFTTGCVIDSVCYPSGTTNPYDPCQWCNPSAYAFGWTGKGTGAPCSDGLFCTVGDTCDGSGQCVGQARSCGNGSSCQTASCNEYQDRCETAVSGCSIDGGCFATSQINPNNPCQYCAPSISASSWTSRSYGAACSDGRFCTVNDACDGFGTCATSQRNCSDNLYCTTDLCNDATQQCESVSLAGCTIGYACYGANTINPQNACQWCQPGASSNTWTSRPVGSGCSGIWDCYGGATCDGGGVCLGGAGGACNDSLGCTVDSCDGTTGQCYHTATSGCAIGNACWAAGIDNPNNSCLTCRPDISTTQWTNKPAETACSDGNLCTVDACNGAGTCVSSAKNCGDGLNCTVDACDAASGSCVWSTASGRCLIDGDCYRAGDSSPDNDCEVCDPTKSATSWSDRPRGTDCVGDVFCTVNRTCDGEGVCAGGTLRDCNDDIQCSIDICDEGQRQCRHVTPYSDGCFIDGLCWGARAGNPSDDCLECAPFRTREAWSLVLSNRCINRLDGGVVEEEADAGPDQPDAAPAPDPLVGGGLAGGSADSKCTVGARLGGSPNLSLWTWLFIWGLFIWRKRRD